MYYYLALPKHIIIMLAESKTKPYSAKRHRFSQYEPLNGATQSTVHGPWLMSTDQKSTEVAKHLETFVPM